LGKVGGGLGDNSRKVKGKQEKDGVQVGEPAFLADGEVERDGGVGVPINSYLLLTDNVVDLLLEALRCG
jgi:hypothetical protein